MQTYPTITAILGAAVLIVTGPGAHAAWLTEPSADITTSYEDNVRMSPEDEDDGYVTTTTVGGRALRVTENSRVAASLDLSWLHYAGVSDREFELEDEDVEVAALNARRSGERFSGGIDGTFIRDVLVRSIAILTDPTGAPVDGELPPVPGGDGGVLEPGDDVDSSYQQEQVRRLRLQAGPYVEYALTERTRARLAYRYLSLSYDDPQDVEITDSSTQRADLRLSHQLTEADDIRLTLGSARFEPDEGADTDTVEATVGWDRRFSDDRSLVGIDVGARRSETDDIDNTGSLLRVRAEIGLESGRMLAQVTRSLVPTNLGDLVETDQVFLALERNLSDRVSLELRARALTFDSEADGDDTFSDDRDYAEIGPELRWHFTETVSLGAGYRYRWIDRERDTGSASVNAVSVSLSYSPQREL